MKIRSSWRCQLLFISLILCAAAVHADSGGPLKISLDPGARAMDLSRAARPYAGYGPELGNGVLTVLGGLIGNFVGLVAGVYLANHAGGKLGLGVPDVHLRPVFVPGGGNAKPEMQFNVNVLRVEL